MQFTALPFRAALEDYQPQAHDLLAAHLAGDPGATEIFHRNHPRFLDPAIPWLPLGLRESEVREAALDISDAELAIARCYNFRDWDALREYVDTVTQDDSPVFRFEAAVECVITGDLTQLHELLRRDPALVRARSSRVTNFDPPVHRATLLHYVAANGVEGYRQKTPPNAVEIAKILLEAGAEVDALADMYGEPCTTMSMLVSSCHPAQAGLQIALADALVDAGASLEGRTDTKWGSPLMTALIFGYCATAEALARRGAPMNDLAAAAGLGRTEEAARLLPEADSETRHRALALAAQHGHAEIVRLILEAGEDPSRFNPPGHHAHATPLHHAAHAGHLEVVKLLVEHGARLDIKDTIWKATPVGWANHGGQKETEDFLSLHAH